MLKKDINKLSNYNEVRDVLLKYGYTEMTLDNIQHVEYEMELDLNTDYNDYDIIRDAINELTDRVERSEQFEEQCEESLEYFSKAKTNFYRKLSGECKDEDEINDRVREITGFKSLNSYKVTGYLVKHNDKLKADEKRVLRGYLMIHTNGDRTFRGYSKYLDRELDEEVLDDIFEDLDDDLDMKIERTKKVERRDRRILGGIATVLTTSTAYALAVGTVCLSETAVLLGLTSICVAGIWLSIRRFGRKIK